MCTKECKCEMLQCFVFSRRSSVGTFIRQPTESSTKSKAPPPKLDYRSMVSVDDMPELFVSFDSKYLLSFFVLNKTLH